MHGNTGKVPNSPPVIISIQQVRRTWFRQQDSIYTTCSCSADQFRAWVEQIAPPTWRDSDARDVLAQTDLDDFDRWFVLSTIEKRLVSAGQSLPVFLDAHCEIAFRSKSERVQPPVVQKVVKTPPKRTQRTHRKQDIAS